MNERLFRAFTRFQTALYRASGGRAMTTIRTAGVTVPVLLLTTKGRKSGRERTTPVIYLEDADSYVVVASAGGRPKNPAWYLNLQNDPEASVQVKTRRLRVHAETADPETRARLWPKLTAMFPPYAEYEQKTTRQIPVVLLRPAEQPADTRAQ